MSDNKADNTVILPIVHNNGDTKKTLLYNLEQAYRAVQAAKKALAECAPNGRNYYPVAGLFPKAYEQHCDRMAHLETVRVSLLQEAHGIQDTCPQGENYAAL